MDTVTIDTRTHTILVIVDQISAILALITDTQVQTTTTIQIRAIPIVRTNQITHTGCQDHDISHDVIGIVVVGIEKVEIHVSTSTSQTTTIHEEI